MNELISAVIGNPWQGVGYYADSLGRDKSNTRRDLKKLVGNGELSGRIEPDGSYSFGPVNGGAFQTTHDGGFASASQAIEGSFKEVQSAAQAASASRELVPPVGQPFDSRTEAALRQHAAARARGNGNRPGATIPAPIVELWNGGFLQGEGLDNLAGSIDRAVQVYEWDRQAEASKAVVPARVEPNMWQLGQSGMGALLRARSSEIERLHDEAARKPETPAPAKQPAVDRIKEQQQEHAEWTEPRGLEPDDFDDAELEEIEALAQEDLQAEGEPEMPPDPPPSKGGAQRINPKRYLVPTFKQRLAAARRKAAETVLARREEADEDFVEPDDEPAMADRHIRNYEQPTSEQQRWQPPRSLRDILASRKSKPEPEPVPTWWQRHFGTPRKAVWK